MKNVRFLKQVLFSSFFGLLIFSMFSCGSSKNSQNEMMMQMMQQMMQQQLQNQQQNQQQNVSQGPKLRESNPVYKLAAQESDKLRAAQSATSYLEDVALENAENAAVIALASRLETAIAGVRERYNRSSQSNGKTMTSQDANNEIKSYISRKLSYVVIGEPAVYDNPDKTITVFVCVEMREKTEKVLEEAYESLTREGVIAIEYDKKRFIEDNKEELKKLQSNIGL